MTRRWCTRGINSRRNCADLRTRARRPGAADQDDSVQRVNHRQIPTTAFVAAHVDRQPLAKRIQSAVELLLDAHAVSRNMHCTSPLPSACIFQGNAAKKLDSILKVMAAHAAKHTEGSVKDIAITIAHFATTCSLKDTLVCCATDQGGRKHTQAAST